MENFDFDTFYSCEETEQDLNDMLRFEQEVPHWSFEEWEMNHADRVSA